MIDYHVHTQLCGHASGSAEEYIESALEKGLAEIGISEHAPMPDEIRAGLTMPAGEVESYIKSVLELRKKYASRIGVKLGFEVDYPPFASFDKKYFSDPRIDYLIGSCHFIDGWGFDHPLFVDGYRERDIDDIYESYFRIILALAGSGLYDVVGHFDIVKKFGHRARKDFLPAVEKIAHTLARRGVAVEINTGGLRHTVSEMYPSDDIIAVLFNCGVPVTLGSDAHAPENMGYSFPQAVEKLKKAGYRKISGFSKRKRYNVPI